MKIDFLFEGAFISISLTHVSVVIITNFLVFLLQMCSGMHHSECQYQSKKLKILLFCIPKYTQTIHALLLSRTISLQ